MSDFEEGVSIDTDEDEDDNEVEGVGDWPCWVARIDSDPDVEALGKSSKTSADAAMLG